MQTRGFMVATIVVVVNLLSAAQPTEAQRHIDAAVAQFKAIDFHSALAELSAGQKAPHGKDEALLIDLYTGIVQAYLGATDEARAAFRAAVATDPAARLPTSVSPKVQALFDETKAREKPPAPAAAIPLGKPKLIVMELGAGGGVEREVATVSPRRSPPRPLSAGSSR